MNENPIGIFDSGIGGLSVVKEIINILPEENIVYFGDTARVPYGTKSKETIKKYAEDDVNFLLKYKPKLIVIACHTVSSYASDYLRKKFKNIKFVDVVKPSVEKAIKVTKNKKIGVIGTTGTISSGRYQLLLSKNNMNVYAKDCPIFVPIVEEGWFENEISYKIAEIYLSEIKKHNIDTLILGCTHYPYLKNVIRKVVGENVEIIEPSYEVAVKTKNILEKNNLIRKNDKGKIYLYFSDIGPYVKKAISFLFDKKIKYKLTKNV
ncbi:MAG: glutamate racemase [Candidatus Omnitrophica bacterium]|nr:glutamate racemase [Candidatus Omnitrophota bacterium]